ncbi:MAG: hypothetical protein B6I22_13480 [Desulfobacteraceae bacterium 4572_123]|nr:MAG: hypothetical protein B6I22_13480 [Desulfobacteraceae bacterium 4572_123]
MNNSIYTVGQAADYCSVSRGTLLRCVKSGKLKASRTPGGHYRISKKDLEDFALEKGMYPLANNRSSMKKVLIVDDDPGVQNVVAEILSAKKYETETASSGYEAGTKVIRFKPGLIILDLFMPEMSGFEVCRQVKEDPETSDIKILAITGHDSLENRGRIMEAGADDYLAKPVKTADLLRHVEDLLKTASS